jgi:hypothetical protein
MRTLMVIAAVAGMVSTAANATRWILVAKTAGVARYIDVDAIVVDDATATIWLRTEYPNQGKHGEARAIEKWMHDCAKARAKLLALTLYKANGSVIGSAELPRYQSQWTTVVPGSVGETIHQRVCGAIDGTSKDRGEDNVKPETVS